MEAGIQTDDSWLVTQSQPNKEKGLKTENHLEKELNQTNVVI